MSLYTYRDGAIWLRLFTMQNNGAEYCTYIPVLQTSHAIYGFLQIYWGRINSGYTNPHFRAKISSAKNLNIWLFYQKKRLPRHRTQTRAELIELYLNWRWLVLFWDKVINKSEHWNLKTDADDRKLSVNFELHLCKQSGQQIALFTFVNHEIRNLPSAECYNSLEAAKHKKCVSG